jgi:hypothetical protein
MVSIHTMANRHVSDCPLVLEETVMAGVITGTIMSLDGFIADAKGSVEHLYSGFANLHDTGYVRTTIERTGAVNVGRETFEMADPDSYVGAYEFQVPIFVVTHHPPRVPPK